MSFPPRSGKLPAQTKSKGQVRPVAPTVLAVHTEIAPARVHGDLGPLRVVARSPDEEVGEVVPRFRTRKTEGPVLGAKLKVRDLVIFVIGAELQGMRSNHFREVVKNLVGIIDVTVVVSSDADAERVETDWLNPFWTPRNDSCESLRAERGTQTTHRLARGIGIADVIHPKLVDGGRAEGLGITKVELLRSANGRVTEARYVAGRIRIQVIVIVPEVVTRNHSHTRIGIDAPAPLVVLEGIRVSGGGEEGPVIGVGDVLH